MAGTAERPSLADHVVVIDDYQEHLDVLVAYLERAGLPATGFTAPREAARHLADRRPALAVVNLYMPDMDGIELSRTLLQRHPGLPLIGITGSRDARADAYLRLLRQYGVKVCLRKPVDGATFVAAVRDLLVRD